MLQHNYRELKIWQRSIEFAVSVYKATFEFPSTERNGLSSQLQRSVVSISSNISEGTGRASTKELQRFLEFSIGSLNEAQSQIEIAFRLKYLSEERYLSLLAESMEISRMIIAFYNSL